MESKLLKRKWYMVVKADKYELPLGPPMRLKDLAAFLGIDITSISHAINGLTANNGKRSGRKYVAFYDDELDDLEKQEKRYWARIGKKIYS